MVTIVKIEKRTAGDGKEFNVLILASEKPELVRSAAGKQYMAVRKASIPCAFDEAMAVNMIGLKLPGSIEKVESEPYTYTMDDGKEIILTHRYVFTEQASNIEEQVFE